jgi:diguanylate cyclase (GGDEF)-like protein
VTLGPFLTLALAANAPSPPQSLPAAELAARLPSLRGLERARALAALTAALRDSDPRQALARGREARELLAAHPDPATEALALAEMAWAHMVLGEYDEARRSGEQASALAERHGDAPGLALSLNNLGVLAQRRGDPVEAVGLFERSLAIRRRLGTDVDVAMSLNNLGFVHATDLADYARGLEYHLEALRIRERARDAQGVALSLNNIGIVYARLREHDKALKYLGDALRLRREQGASPRIASTLNNIGDVYAQMGDHARSLEINLEALALRSTLGDRWAIATSLRDVGAAYLELGDLGEADRRLGEALDLAEAMGDKGLLTRSLLAVAALDRRRGQAARATRSAARAIAIAEAMPSPELARRGYEELAAAQEAAGELAAALAAHKRLKVVSDAIFDEQRARRLGLLEKQYEAERREREIERLKGEQALQALTLSRERLRRNALAGVAVFLAVLGFLAYWRRVESAKLAEELSLTDSLTGLRNRRFVAQTVDTDVATSRRKHLVARERGESLWNADLVFMLIDVDGFKAINDRYGHAAGDRVLVQVAQLLREELRTTDTLARWGGEEFLALCRFVDRGGASTLAERVRAGVAGHPFDVGGGGTIHCTCSIGFAAYPFSRQAPDALGWEQVVALADQALYAAKRAGRNAWTGLLSTPSSPLEALAGRRPVDVAAAVERGELAIVASPRAAVAS